MTTITQTAPWPTELEAIVDGCTYRRHEGWRLRLDADQDRDEVDGQLVGHGTTLMVTTKGYDTYNPDQGANYRVSHYFIVPAATYNRAAWMRWLHGPGCNPYVVHELATDVERRTRFTGEVVQ